MLALAKLAVGPLGQLIGFLLLIAAVWWYVDSHAYDRGYNDAVAVIRAQNEKASETAKNTVKDVDACWGKGGRWDVETGTCIE